MHDQSVSDHSRGTRTHTDTDTDTDTHAISPSSCSLSMTRMRAWFEAAVESTHEDTVVNDSLELVRVGAFARIEHWGRECT